MAGSHKLFLILCLGIAVVFPFLFLVFYPDAFMVTCVSVPAFFIAVAVLFVLSNFRDLIDSDFVKIDRKYNIAAVYISIILFLPFPLIVLSLYTDFQIFQILRKFAGVFLLVDLILIVYLPWYFMYVISLLIKNFKSRYAYSHLAALLGLLTSTGLFALALMNG